MTKTTASPSILSAMSFLGILVVLCIAVPPVDAKRAKSDWDTYFGAGISPAYPYAATLRITLSKDDHFSSTNGNGDTTNFHCSTTSTSVDCAEGTGLYHDLVLESGGSIFVGSQSFEGDPLGWMIPETPVPYDFSLDNAKNGHVFHFRWKESPSALGRVLCIQVAGTESIPDGKEKKKYAKHHRMESCYFAIPNKYN